MSYYGSTIFSALADQIKVPIDELNFIVAQCFAILVGPVMRSYVKPCETNTFKRHLFVLLVGISMAWFCHGIQIVHLLFQSAISYILLWHAPAECVHFSILIFTIGYLRVFHILNFWLNTEINQRVRPSLIEYLSYTFSYQTILVGPFCFYKDHIEFMTGRNITKHQNTSSNLYDQPDNKFILMKKICLTIAYVILLMSFSSKYTAMSNLDHTVLEMNFIVRLGYMWFTAFIHRCVFYFAWTLADLACNSSGLGFNGYDINNKSSKWDLLTNFNFKNIEFATSIKMILDSWNIQTQKWLKFVCFERLPKFKTLGVFVLTIIWHGLEARFLLSFISTAINVFANRSVRQNAGLIVQRNKLLLLVYGVLSWVFTVIGHSYAGQAFIISDTDSCIRYYSSFFWLGQLISILLCLPMIYIETIKKSKAK